MPCTSNDYLIHFAERDLELIIEALQYYGLQGLMGTRAAWAGSMARELEAYKERQDCELSQPQGSDAGPLESKSQDEEGTKSNA